MNPEAHWKSLPPVEPPQSTAQKLLGLWPFWLAMLLFLGFICAGFFATWLFAEMGRTPGRFTTIRDVAALTLEYATAHILPILSSCAVLGTAAFAVMRFRHR